ncbi:hypothetical protein K2Q16_01070 [Patescibacteria group bacterium]|nr:hypothetical protein [Patescibacteria group bacterium]
MLFQFDDELAPDEEMDDEEATLADDLLDEVGVDEEEVPEDIEGFGHITEEAVAEEEEETDEEKAEEGVPLEEDAEDVDFDTFDDVDEL